MFRHVSFASLYGLLLMTAACAGTSVSTGVSVSGCGSPGANMNEHDVGDEPGGVSLELGEVAVSPTGSFVIFKGKTSLLVGWPGDGSVDQLSIQAPTKLAFSKKSTVVYVASSRDGRVHAVDVAQNQDLWSAPLPDAGQYDLRFAASKDDARLLITGGSRLTVLDARTGAIVAQRDFDRSVIDLQILPDDARALVVTATNWPADAASPTSEVAVVGVADGKVSSFDVPNCASELAITPDGSKAFLSPSLCQKDPISLLDLTPGKEGWVKNLPGFGPLALGPTGATAIAFLDTQDLDTTLFDDPGQIPPHGENDPRYYIMTLDTKTLKYDFTLFGDSIPRYQLTPDGRALLIDSPWGSSEPSSARIFDTTTRTFRPIVGGQVTFDDFVITDDSKHVYAVDLDLVDIDVTAGTATKLDTSGFLPSNINIAPDGKTLYLRRSADTICIYDIAAQDCREVFTAPLGRIAGN